MRRRPGLALWLRGPTKPGEVLRGRDGAFTDYITRQQPVLLLFDLHNLAIPWQYWISLIKTSPATRRIPILCFGSHVDTEALKTAKAVGADEVVARSRFFAAMPELVQKQARQWDVAGIAAACQQPLSDHARTGLHLFNQGEYFQATKPWSMPGMKTHLPPVNVIGLFCRLLSLTCKFSAATTMVRLKCSYGCASGLIPCLTPVMA